MNGVNRQAYIADVIANVIANVIAEIAADWPAFRWEELTSWSWQDNSTAPFAQEA
jgi:hypothetical protein